MSSSNAVTKRSSPTSDTALMPPPPPPKRIKRPPQVLEEDTYTSALSHIIARDYFPGLLEVEAQQDFLDALDAGNGEWIEEAGRRVKEVMTPSHSSGRTPRRGVSMTPKSSSLGETPKGWRGETPAGTATPASTTTGSEAPSLQPGTNTFNNDVNMNLNLTNFQARYTSEDNESFNKIVDKQNAKRAERHAWMWNGNKIPSAREIAQVAQKEQPRLIKAASSRGEKKEAEGNGSQALVLRPSENQEDRPAIVDSARARHAPRNGLMFTPDDMESTHPHLQSVAQAAADASKAAPKAVSYNNTRFSVASSSTDSPEEAIPPSPSISAIDSAIRGQLEGSRPSVASSAVVDDDDGSQTPRVNGYAFVDADPTPSELDIAEGRHPDINKPSPSDPGDILTQMIKARDDASQDDSNSNAYNPFNVQASSRREKLHHSMVEKSLKAKRGPPKNSRLQELQEGGGKAGKTPTPKFASSPKLSSIMERVGGLEAASTPENRRTPGNLTPEARSLYGKLGTEKGQGAGSGGRDIGASGIFDTSPGARTSKGAWTPTPLRVKKAT